MSLYRHSVTGNQAELTPAYVLGFAPGTWELLEEEGPAERREREIEEARANKVEIEAEPIEPPPAVVDEALNAQQEKAVEALNLAAAEPAGESKPVAKKAKGKPAAAADKEGTV